MTAPGSGHQGGRHGGRHGGQRDGSGGPAPDVVVDARGLRCPLPVIRLAQAARTAADGSLIEVLATDPAARADIPAWCRMRRQELAGVVEVTDDLGEHTAYRVVVSAAP